MALEHFTIPVVSAKSENAPWDGDVLICFGVVSRVGWWIRGGLVGEEREDIKQLEDMLARTL